MGQLSSKASGSQGGRTLRYAKGKGEELRAAVKPGKRQLDSQIKTLSVLETLYSHESSSPRCP